MGGLKSKWRVITVVIFAVCAGLAGLMELLKPVPNGCNMTYMYPTYIPISAANNISAGKYGLYLYHEGWRKIDYDAHLKQLSGVPVLFIPGNGGSYKQVRSLAAESDRAFQGGPLESTFYQESSFTPEEAGLSSSSNGRQEEDMRTIFSSIRGQNQYPNVLDWFAVDLEGEHSAMDGRILEEHTEYVVQAIHRVLDRYKESFNTRLKDSKENSGILPTSVILVGHSMGGFVARAAVVHPNLRKGVVETIITLSSPHRSPPVALQPSLGHFFSQVNKAWRNGYQIQRTRSGRWVSDPMLSNVVVISISGGIHDYQVRSTLASLEGIVPPTHGLTIGATGMRDVWLSMEHQSILWCNQLVIQVAHAMLHLIDQNTGQPLSSTQKRLAVFISTLRSGIPQNFGWMSSVQLQHYAKHLPITVEELGISGKPGWMKDQFSCPGSTKWADDSRERDLYIEGTTVTVLAMDGRRRWMDIKKLASDGKDNFIFVTNLAPCVGVRIHLWPEKSKLSLREKVPAIKRVVEVTSKMVNIPAGPAPRQIEPGSQTEQAPPSAVLCLDPDELHGFRFLTISVAPRPTISGRPPPAASMAVGQFFNPRQGRVKFSPQLLLQSSYKEQDLILQDNHPLILNLSFSISMGILPVTLKVKTLGCGIKDSVLPNEQIGDEEHSSLCKLRCFPPVVLVWDTESGLTVIPNLYSDTIAMDSSPALWGSRHDSEKTTLLLMVDPHCSYKISSSISLSAAASKFILLHGSQIIGFMMSILFFMLMKQARAWELDLPIPSVLSAVESNLRLPLSFSFLALGPLVVHMGLAVFAKEPTPPLASFVMVSLVCYTFANGAVVILTLSTQLFFYVAASIQVFFKQRWQAWEHRLHVDFVSRFLDRFSILSSFQVSFIFLMIIKMLRGRPTFTVGVIAIVLISFLHPALGLIILLLSHAWCCHTALCSHRHRKGDWSNSKLKADIFPPQADRVIMDGFEMEGNHSPNSAISFGDTQLETFNYQQGMLLLHLAATAMLVPSLVAWGQRLGMDQSIPWFLDSALSLGIVLHAFCASKANYNVLLFPFPHFWVTRVKEAGLSIVYCLAGFYCYFSGLALAPYRSFYAMATVGLVSVCFRIAEKRYREKGDFHLNRRHSHRH
ncbi:uncharacterized protein LOC131073079 isoform X3 [Cryptomeria japonica]|uniref:uncharacterized protein LOC131073079 isoform X3 n=1 Tax=Cryptomeria japonica TaxID=3369 RepID=UPI0025AD44CB|nr:uncharacterized protein LOC131073079 isoform X3 [Cryptomeria japonica]